MLKSEEVFNLIRAGKLRALHDQLDAALHNASSDELHSIAHWRTAALLKEKRYDDALQYLEDSKDKYNCKTTAYQQKAEILDRLGRGPAAVAELSAAPFDVELKLHLSLVIDAFFFLLYLKEKNGISVAKSELDRIPDGFTSIINGMGPFTKHDLEAMIV